MALRDKIVPLIVASPLFLQNIDTSAMATALPTIAAALQVQALHLNLAITSYLLSFAVFLPMSGWLAERFGAKRTFCWAIGLFTLGSALCGAANSLAWLVCCRLLQGLGGAMMVPVARLILLRSVPPAAMVAALVWFTVPPTIGRMMGPLFGGVIVTWTSWRWIFLVNVPFGLLGILLARRYIKDSPPSESPAPFDLLGFVLMAAGLTGMLGALEMAGKSVLAPWQNWSIAGCGALALLAYWFHSRTKADPLIDLGVLRHTGFRTSMLGGMPLRIAIGASPFLLPLMFQLGFGLSPLDSGLLTVATAIGSLSTRALVSKAISRIGFRSLLIASAGVASLFYMSYSFFTPGTPRPLIFCTLLLGGLVTAMAMVGLMTLGFSKLPKPDQSHATTLHTMTNQLSVSFGVVMGASLVSAAALWRGGKPTQLIAADFSPAFLTIGCLTLISMFAFTRLPKDQGEEIR